MGQGVLGVVVADLEMHIRVLLDEPLHEVGDGVGHDGVHHRHGELVRLRPVADLQRLLPQAVDLGGQGQKLLALGGQLDGTLAFLAEEKGVAQLRLQPADLLAEGGLGDRHGLGRLGKVGLGSGEDEHFQRI